MLRTDETLRQLRDRSQSLIELIGIFSAYPHTGDETRIRELRGELKTIQDELLTKALADSE